MKSPLFEMMIKALCRRFLKDCLIVEKDREGVIRSGSFLPCDLTKYEMVDKARNLVLQKGKYKVLPRGAQADNDKGPPGPGNPPGMMVIDNSLDSYNRFWSSKEMLDGYLDGVRTGFYGRVAEACKGFLKGRVIDVGCGSGDFLKIIRGNCGGEIHGVDFSAASIDRCRQIMPEGRFAIGDIYGLDYESGYFDVVICMETLEHLEAPEAAFRELRRICRNGGTIIITVPNGDFDDYVGHLNFWNREGFEDFLGNAELLDFKWMGEREGDRMDMLFIIKN